RILQGVEDNPYHPYIRLLQSTGGFEVETAGPNYDGDLFGDGSSLGADPSGAGFSIDHTVQSTNFYSGQPSGYSFKDVKVQSDGSIQVTFSGPVVDQCGDPLCADGPGCQPVSCAVPKGCAAAPGLFALLGVLVIVRRPRVLSP